jgi:hypothetical protein
LYDIDFDFPNNRLRFWKPGTVMTHPDIRRDLIAIPAATINETGLIGIRITIPQHQKSNIPPILGFLDCGSPFSIMNWAATSYLGLPSNRNDVIYQDRNRPEVLGIGIDGRPIQLPTQSIQLTFAGDAVSSSSSSTTKSIIGFVPPPSSWKPWQPIDIAIGDLPAFSLLLSPNPKQPYHGPAALIGLDILSQRRILFEAQHPDLSRQRTLFIS